MVRRLRRTAMEIPEAQPVGHWASKRSACDRCRSHKLRCLRAGHGRNSVSCARCIRANVECVTGSTKPAGRPPRARIQHRDSIHLISNAPDLAQSQPSSGQWTDAPTPLDAGIFFDCFDNFSMNYAPSPSSSIPDSRIQPLSSEEDQQRPRTESCASPFFTALSIGCSDPTLLLSSLNLSLSRQLSLVKSEPASSTTCSMGINETHELPTTGNSKEANPLHDILHSTSEFLAIIQMYLPTDDQLSTHCDPMMGGHQLSSSLSPTGLTCSNPGSPYCIITTLALLSCYVQIIAIFNAIFWKIYASLCGSPEASMSGLQMVLDLHLAGFPLQHGTLQIKILIQVIMHQSEMIEKALGLPVEYRVSGRQEHYAGLLGGREARGLVRAVMGIIEEEQQNEGPGGDVTEVGLGLGYVRLLRENIERIGKLLQI